MFFIGANVYSSGVAACAHLLDDVLNCRVFLQDQSRLPFGTLNGNQEHNFIEAQEWWKGKQTVDERLSKWSCTIDMHATWKCSFCYLATIPKTFPRVLHHKMPYDPQSSFLSRLLWPRYLGLNLSSYTLYTNMFKPSADIVWRESWFDGIEQLLSPGYLELVINNIWRRRGILHDFL